MTKSEGFQKCKNDLTLKILHHDKVKEEKVFKKLNG